MYDYVALHLTHTTIRLVLFSLAVVLWILYFHEVLFRSGKVRAHWLRKGLADFLLMLSIAIVTFLVFFLVSGFPIYHRAR